MRPILSALALLGTLGLLAIPAAAQTAEARTNGSMSDGTSADEIGTEIGEALPDGGESGSTDVTIAGEPPSEAQQQAGVAEAGAEDDPMTPRDARDLTLDEFLWVARPIVVFADTPADPRFIEQMELLADRPEPLIERDVVILFDTDPAARSAIRTQLRPRGFAVVVIAKDGSVGLRRPSPRDVREIIRAIDNFSLRQEEMRRDG